MALNQKQFHRISKALADPRRYQIFARIAARKELACSDLRGKLPITAATLSHHLKDLADAGLIEVRREGKFLHLSLQRDVWQEYLNTLNRI